MPNGRRLAEVVRRETRARPAPALVQRHEQQRVLAQRAAHLHVDAPLGQVRVGLAGTRPVVARAEADGLAVGAAREDPGEAVERALGLSWSSARARA